MRWAPAGRGRGPGGSRQAGEPSQGRCDPYSPAGSKGAGRTRKGTQMWVAAWRMGMSTI